MKPVGDEDDGIAQRANSNQRQAVSGEQKADKRKSDEAESLAYWKRARPFRLGSLRLALDLIANSEFLI